MRMRAGRKENEDSVWREGEAGEKEEGGREEKDCMCVAHLRSCRPLLCCRKEAGALRVPPPLPPRLPDSSLWLMLCEGGEYGNQ